MNKVKIYNFWLRFDNAFKAEMEAAYRMQTYVAQEINEIPPAKPAVLYPFINTANQMTKDLIRRRVFQEAEFFTANGYSTDNILSLYTLLGQSLEELTVVREDFQLWEDRYPGVVECVGAWGWDGEPIGGAGSPWFPSPREIKNIGNVILRTGQAPRAFV